MMVFACDSCKHYLKAVDLAVTRVARSLVDEVAAASLDLWAAQQEYTKTVPNLMACELLAKFGGRACLVLALALV
jgi:formate dehydrogenase maturation protein FdhE